MPAHLHENQPFFFSLLFSSFRSVIYNLISMLAETRRNQASHTHCFLQSRYALMQKSAVGMVTQNWRLCPLEIIGAHVSVTAVSMQTSQTPGRSFLARIEVLARPLATAHKYVSYVYCSDDDDDGKYLSINSLAELLTGLGIPWPFFCLTLVCHSVGSLLGYEYQLINIPTYRYA